MRDSLGGIPVIVIVTLFIVITLGYIAYNVNYTKAFRMKNKAIDLFEEFGGGEACSGSSKCRGMLVKYADTIGYKPDSLNCGFFGAESVSNLVCYTTNTTDVYTQQNREDLHIVDEGQGTFYNDVYTKVNIDLPIIRNMLISGSVFYVTGSTKSMSILS